LFISLTILIFIETIEEIEKYREGRRVPFINKDLLESATDWDTDSGTSSADLQPLKKNKKDTTVSEWLFFYLMIYI